MRYLILLIFFCLLPLEIIYTQISPSDHCQSILDKLIESHGELRDDYPTILITDRKRKIASYSPVKNQIIIEKTAYEICLTLEAKANDALAFLISHELTHFFQVKQWKVAKKSMAFYDDRDSYNEHKKNEAEADRFGAFLCYLSGYDYFNTAPLIIEKLYKEYSLNSFSHSYPSLEERKRLSTDVCKVIRHFTIIYQCANYMSLIGRYSISQSLYKYLLNHLDLSEIYHNTGTNQLKSVLSYSNSKKPYPIDIMYQLNLRDGLDEDPKKVLSHAITNLKLSAQKAPQNHQSFINLCVAHLENNELNEAQSVLNALKSINVSSKTSEMISQLENIILNNVDTEIDSQEIEKIEWNSSLDYPSMDDSFKIIFDDSDPLFPGQIEILDKNGLFVRIEKADFTAEIKIDDLNEKSDYFAFKIVGENNYLIASDPQSERDQIALISIK